MFSSLPAPCQPEFGLWAHSPEISSVICSCSGSKIFISLDIRYLSCLQFSISNIFLSYPDSQPFIGFMFFSWSRFRNSCFGCLIHTSLILIRYRGTLNFISSVFVSNTDFRNFIFIIFLFFMRQTSSPWCSSLVLAPSLTSVPALIPQSEYSYGRWW